MYFTPVRILSLILISLCPHYDLNLVSLRLTLVWPLWPNSDHLRHSPLLTLWGKLGTQMFRKGATHKLKPSPSDITTIRLSNSIIGPLRSPRNTSLLNVVTSPSTFSCSQLSAVFLCVAAHLVIFIYDVIDGESLIPPPYFRICPRSSNDLMLTHFVSLFQCLPLGFPFSI